MTSDQLMLTRNPYHILTTTTTTNASSHSRLGHRNKQMFQLRLAQLVV